MILELKGGLLKGRRRGKWLLDDLTVVIEQGELNLGEKHKVIINFLFGFKLWLEAIASWPLMTSRVSRGHNHMGGLVQSQNGLTHQLLVFKSSYGGTVWWVQLRSGTNYIMCHVLSKNGHKPPLAATLSTCFHSLPLPSFQQLPPLPSLPLPIPIPPIPPPFITVTLDLTPVANLVAVNILTTFSYVSVVFSYWVGIQQSIYFG